MVTYPGSPRSASAGHCSPLLPEAGFDGIQHHIEPKASLAGARVNGLPTKVDR
jgi:hypothetical protein